MSVWTGRGSHLTPRNGANGEDIEKLMMAEAAKAKAAKPSRQRPKSAAVPDSSKTSNRIHAASTMATAVTGSSRAPLGSVVSVTIFISVMHG